MPLDNLKKNIASQRKIINELNSLFSQIQRTQNPQEKNLILGQIDSLKNSLRQETQNTLENLRKTNVPRKLNPGSNQKIQKNPQMQIQTQNQNISGQQQNLQAQNSARQFSQPAKKSPIEFFQNPSERREKFDKKKKEKIESMQNLEKKTLKKIKRKIEKGEKKEKQKKTKSKKKPSKYVGLANKFFSNYSRNLIKQGKFSSVERSIVKAKMPVVPASYISVIFFTTALSIIAAFFIFLFFLFFNISAELPIITLASEGFLLRLLKVFWILFVFPAGTFLFMYFYPSMEEKSAATKINRELPFATIHMAAISGSMIDPSNIFSIIISTKEYPYLEKEFTRLINEINVYGYDLVTALKNIALNSPSKKLSELLTGLATTISSGGDLPNFFDKRSESLLFEYKIDKEKYTKTAETFMDIYISIVIAAPMILMLLLVMIRISGLGLSLSTSTITLITVLGVLIINIIFLSFLHLKQPGE